MDSGDILLQKRTNKDINENAEELSHRLSILGADLLIEAIGLLKEERLFLSTR
jgi:methionyl-tRNA formyltransferase